MFRNFFTNNTKTWKHLSKGCLVMGTTACFGVLYFDKMNPHPLIDPLPSNTSSPLPLNSPLVNINQLSLLNTRSRDEDEWPSQYLLNPFAAGFQDLPFHVSLLGGGGGGDDSNNNNNGKKKSNKDAYKYKKDRLVYEIKKRKRESDGRLAVGMTGRGQEFTDLRVSSTGLGKDEVFCIEFIAADSDFDMHAALTCWLQILQPGKVELHSNDPNRKLLAFTNEDNSCSLVLKTMKKPSLSVYKDGGFEPKDVDFMMAGYEAALLGRRLKWDDSSSLTVERRQQETPISGYPNQTTEISSANPTAIAALRTLGIDVYEVDPNKKITWNALAGYDRVKKEIKDSVITALQFPDLYDDIAKHTRENYESNRPKAVLLEGPPGTGKTLTARIIANECGRPMVHLPLERIVSKWYGESEKQLTKIFDSCEQLGGAVIFIDEIDSLVGSRDDSNMHEVTRRILSILLQRLEGFSGQGSNVLICATNRKQDLDSALLSRFDVTIAYNLPDLSTRAEIFKLYAKQLNKNNLNELAAMTEGMSSRDIKEICRHTERKFAARLVANGQKEPNSRKGLPTVKDYIDSITIRGHSIAIQDKSSHQNI